MQAEKVSHRASLISWMPIGLTMLFGILQLGTFQIGSYMDDAWYIAEADALAAGLGFVRPWTPTLMPETFLPIGYPLLLAPLRWLFPDSFLPLQFLSMAATLGTVTLWGLYYREHLEHPLAWLATLLLAVHVGTVRFSTLVMSDAVYTFLATLGVILIDRYCRANKWGPIAYLLTGLLATGAYLVRSWGIALIAAASLYLLLRRKWIGVFAIVVPFVSFYGLWSARNAAAGGVGASYGIDLTSISTIPPDLFADFFPRNLATWTRRLPNALFPFFGPQVSAFLERVGAEVLISLVGLLIALTVGTGYISKVMRRFSLVEVYMLSYSAILAIAPPEGIDRYLLPIVPLLFYYFVAGLQYWSSGISARTGWRQLAHYGVSVLLIGLALLHVYRDVQGVLDPVKNRIPDISLGARWIAHNTPPDALIMALIPHVTFLYSDRKVLPFPDYSGDVYQAYPKLKAGGSQSRFYEAIDVFGIDYVLIEPKLRAGLPFQWSDYIQRDIVPVLETDTSHFDLVYSDKSGLTRVYRVCAN